MQARQLQTDGIAVFTDAARLLVSFAVQSTWSSAVQTSEHTPRNRRRLRRYAPAAVTALLCLLPLAMTHAAEAKKHTGKTTVRPAAPIKTIHWQDISLSIKDSLAWLRDTTVTGLMPKHDGAFNQASWNNVTATQFDLERELFKSVSHENSRESLKQSGLKVGSNTQFQWDVQRYWNVNDHQEVAVKLGLHFDFR